MRPAVRRAIFANSKPKTLLKVDLRASLIPVKAIDPAIACSRASTGSVIDWEGLVNTAKIGEARFEGARREENLVNKSETSVSSDLNANKGALVTLTDTTEAGLPAGTTNSFKASLSAGTNYTFFRKYNAGNIGDVLSVRLYAKKGTYRYIGLRIGYPTPPESLVFDFDTGTFNNTGIASNYGKKGVGNGWWLLWAVGLPMTVTSRYHEIGLPTVDGTNYLTAAGTETIYVTGVQFELVTGQANQNPSEYVSTNIKTSAPYHGSNVDGVKCSTTLNGNTVSNNVVTEAVGANIPESTLLGYLSEGSAINLLLNSAAPVTQNITTTAQNYTVSHYGTGTVTLSGAATGTLVGSDANTRVKMTVAASAGTVTLTYSGSTTKGQFEAGNIATSYITTGGSSITRVADALSYPKVNFFEPSFTIYLTVTATDWGNVAGQYLGDGTNMPLKASTTNSGVCAFDGTNTVNGPAGAPTGTMKYAIRGENGMMQIFANGIAGSPGPYKGAFNLANLGIGGSGFFGNIKGLEIQKGCASASECVRRTL